jgi:acylphosphatase
MKTLARIYLVEGRVQGVGFRFFVEAEARKLALRGYVRNLDDGRVEVYAIGNESVLDGLRLRLEQGPPASRVERVEERVAPRKEYREFLIEATGQASY